MGIISHTTSISCHFRDYKALLVTSLTHVSGAIASDQPLPYLDSVTPSRRTTDGRGHELLLLLLLLLL